MRVLLVITDAPWYEPTGYADAWQRTLRAHGCEVERLARAPSSPGPRWDLVVAHVLNEEVAARAPTLRLAMALEAAGAALVNPVSALVAAADKLATHERWAAHGLPQPATWRLGDLARWPGDRGPLVLKPALGDGGRHVTLVSNLHEAHAAAASWPQREGPAVLQQWIEEPACVRIYATPGRVSAAYEKRRAPGALVTHGTVYRRAFEPPAAMARLARRMVGSLGGGLMGVDILTDAQGRHWALEANGPFGFDVTDPGQACFVAQCAVAAAHRGTMPGGCSGCAPDLTPGT
ncbi:MAG: ATP-grasp domain-containing protein [Actinobacteria bacterium]|nr:ATP-grasp domain-containing protein [Actinomycetota bacterium]